jgi:hypothetical protein
MKRISFLALAASVTVLMGLTTPQSHAQLPNRGGRMQGDRINNANIMGSASMLSNLRLTDPAMSSVLVLLKRNDVRSEILLSARQKEQIDAMEQQLPGDLMQKMRQERPDMQALRDLPEEERRERVRLMGDKFQTTLRSFSEDLDKRLEKILRPEQVARLRELDFQWRGGLCLANPVLAESMGLSPEQRAKTNEFMNEYRKAMGEVFQSAFASMSPNTRNTVPGVGNRQTNTAPNAVQPDAQGNAAQNRNPNQPPPPPTPARQMINPQEIINRLNLAGKELDKVRKTIGDKVLTTVLEPAQLEVWKRACGRKFTFRTND